MPGDKLATSPAAQDENLKLLRLNHFFVPDALVRAHIAVLEGPSAQRLYPAGDSLTDLIRRIFLDEVEPRDLHLGLGREAAGQVENRAVGEDSTGLGSQ